MTVNWSGPAARDMRGLDRAMAARVRSAVLRYAATGHGDVKRLQGSRLRVGDWRVSFVVDRSRDVLTVVRVLRRDEAYR